MDTEDEEVKYFRGHSRLVDLISKDECPNDMTTKYFFYAVAMPRHRFEIILIIEIIKGKMSTENINSIIKQNFLCIYKNRINYCNSSNIVANSWLP